MQTHSSKNQPTHFFMNPFEKFIALNIKTMQRLSYINPGELSHFQPEQLLEKNMDILIGNSHILLDYMHEVFLIAESNLLDSSKEIEKKAQSTFHESFSKIKSMAQDVNEASRSKASTKDHVRKSTKKSKA